MTIAPPAEPVSATPEDGPGAALLRTLTELTADLPDADPGRIAAAALRGRSARADEAELRDLATEAAAGLISEDPDYSRLAARLLTRSIAAEAASQGVTSFTESVAVGHREGLIADRTDAFVRVHAARLDALITAGPRLAMVVVTADCVPVLMADARAGVVAAVHAGRVGAQRGVVVRALEGMLSAGAQIADISVFLGPAVSGSHYEVPAAMADEVDAALPGSRAVTAAGTPGLDLRAGIARQLRELGIEAIESDPRCTAADKNLFSHRRDGRTGRLASLVWLE